MAPTTLSLSLAGKTAIVTGSGRENGIGAGTGQGKLLVDLTPDKVQKAFALNTFSTLYTAHAVAPHMPAGGRIANIGSVVSRIHNMPGVGVYGVSKAAQEYLTVALEDEVGCFQFRSRVWLLDF
jgi:NAD(P)-dependent dehydrogenase (short-subunit alcohol dehydrogenase family)